MLEKGVEFEWLRLLFLNDEELEDVYRKLEDWNKKPEILAILNKSE